MKRKYQIRKNRKMKEKQKDTTNKKDKEKRENNKSSPLRIKDFKLVFCLSKNTV